jgi:hypothetical protein
MFKPTSRHMLGVPSCQLSHRLLGREPTLHCLRGCQLSLQLLVSCCIHVGYRRSRCRIVPGVVGALLSPVALGTATPRLSRLLSSRVQAGLQFRACSSAACDAAGRRCFTAPLAKRAAYL